MVDSCFWAYVLLHWVENDGGLSICAGNIDTQSTKILEEERELSAEYEVGLVDSLAAFEKYQESGGDLTGLLAWRDHPNEADHGMIVLEILR